MQNFEQFFNNLILRHGIKIITEESKHYVNLLYESCTVLEPKIVNDIEGYSELVSADPVINRAVACQLSNFVSTIFDRLNQETKQQQYPKQEPTQVVNYKDNDDKQLQSIQVDDDQLKSRKRSQSIINSIQSDKAQNEISSEEKKEQQNGSQATSKCEVGNLPRKITQLENIQPSRKLVQKQSLQKTGLKAQLQKQGKQRCKYFPFCKNQEKCKFFHPFQKCLYFPKCNFGSNCLYIHEICKKPQKCKILRCPYTHSFKNDSIKKMMIQNMQMSRGNMTHPFSFGMPFQRE